MSTVVAVATPPGAGAISIVRISGASTKRLLSETVFPVSVHFTDYKPYVLHRGRFLDQRGDAVDDVLAVFMPGPHSYTGEDMAEIHCHGNPLIVQIILTTLLHLGAEQAGHGEFTRRAFLNGKIDLSQAEAVAELVAASSQEALRCDLDRLDGSITQKIILLRDQIDTLRMHLALALDFPEEETDLLDPADLVRQIDTALENIQTLLAGKKRGLLMQEGASVVLAGATNAGKSSLLNALLGRERALVTDQPGTTRDFLEERCNLDGLPVRLVDTAGFRDPVALPHLDLAETLGIERSQARLSGADCLLLVLDGATLGSAAANSPTCPDPVALHILSLTAHLPVVMVWNKMDLCTPAVSPPLWVGQRPFCSVSARTGENLEQLATSVKQLILADAQAPAMYGLTPNARQSLLLEEALAELQILRTELLEQRSYDCCAVRLDTVTSKLAEITGLSTSAEILDKIFASFCIGK